MKTILASILIAVLGALAANAFNLGAPLDEYTVSSEFGIRRDPMGGARDTFHGGVDLVAAVGSAVRSAAAGTVIETWFPAGTPYPGGGFYEGHPIYGGMVLIKHAEGRYTLYGHLSRIVVYEGEMIRQGTPIGIIGNTGISTGLHLHFEVLTSPVFSPLPPLPNPMDVKMARFALAFRARAQEERNVTR